MCSRIGAFLCECFFKYMANPSQRNAIPFKNIWCYVLHSFVHFPGMRLWATGPFWMDFLVQKQLNQPAMAPHSSTLAWKIPWTEEPGRLQSMESRRVKRDSNFTFTFHFHTLEKEMATHSSVLAWRIPETGEPDGLPSMRSHRARHNWSNLAAK